MESMRLGLKLLLCVLCLIPGLWAKGEELKIYTDGLETGWQNWSWGVTLDFNNPSPTHQGAGSLAVTYNQAWAGLYLHTNTVIPGHMYHKLSFWIHGGTTGGHQLTVTLADENNNLTSVSINATSAANTWTQVEMELSDLGQPNGISGMVWQEASGGAQPVFYLDEISLISESGKITRGFFIPYQKGPDLHVNGGTPLHAIQPEIYGMNHADAALAADLDLPIRRWGGNATTRYNWKNDTSNRASDWFFENIPNDNANPGLLPDGSASDKFVEQNLATGTKSLITVPMIGWTPKARQIHGGFSVQKYGPQQAVDPWQPDCGNGVYPNGNLVTGNDPLDTSVAIDQTFVQDWVNHLKGKYGVRYYNLDNEPMLWNSTHRDVHPKAVGYDDMRDMTYLYAAAIKAADPSAITLGPVVWGWTAYFYSALDAEPGGQWWLNPLDRNAHGGIPFCEWYLQQMKDYETANGIRILDYLDIHYYPQAPGVSLSGSGNGATQALRLRSTRSLWDPTYQDESWIDTPVRLIPMMREWVDQNYPGTKLAVTEYNWGAFDHINGALAQADVLGIFGREGLDLATLWEGPEFNDPVSFAFRMYRNYDGLGGQFGDLSALSTSTDQGLLSVYSALRSADNAMTIVVINKSKMVLKSRLSLSNVTHSGSAEVYFYSKGNLNKIKREKDIKVGGNGFKRIYMPESITLFVLR